MVLVTVVLANAQRYLTKVWAPCRHPPSVYIKGKGEAKKKIIEILPRLCRKVSMKRGAP
jgi:hypothetical protein